MSKPVDTVKSFYAAVAAGDAAGVIAVLADRLEWTEAEGFTYYSGTWRRPNEIIDKLLAPISKGWDDFAAKPDEFVETGARVITFGHYSGKANATGKLMRAPFAHVWGVENGKIVRFDMYTDTLLIARAMQRV